MSLERFICGMLWERRVKGYDLTAFLLSHPNYKSGRSDPDSCHICKGRLTKVTKHKCVYRHTGPVLGDGKSYSTWSRLHVTAAWCQVTRLLSRLLVLAPK